MKLPALLIVASLVGGCAGISAQQRAVGPSPGGVMVVPTIDTFSETEPYLAVARHGDHVYAATPTRLLRFALAGGATDAVEEIDYPGRERVSALASDGREGIWALTAEGLFSLAQGVWVRVAERPPCGDGYQMLSLGQALWLASAGGLCQFIDGQWRVHLPETTVTCMAAHPDGERLWVGTDSDGVYEVAGGSMTLHAARAGQGVRRVLGLAPRPDGGVLVAGRGVEGDILARYDGAVWTSDLLSPRAPVQWMAQAGDATLLAAGDAVYRVVPAAASRPPAGRAGTTISLVSLTAPEVRRGARGPALSLVPHDDWLPRRPIALFARDGELILGTRSAGAVRYDGQQVTWYRTWRLGRDVGAKLNLACSAVGCYVAGPRGEALRVDDAEMVSLFPERALTTMRVHAFSKDAQGRLLAWHSPINKKNLKISIVERDKFELFREINLRIPDDPVVRLVRHGPAGQTWAVLASSDSRGHLSPWGAAVIEEEGRVIYHRSMLLAGETREAGALALPEDIREVLFAPDAVWLATGAGAVRVRGLDVTLFSENEGLLSEVIYDLARTSAGEILAATSAGVGRFDGTTWRFEQFLPVAEDLSPAVDRSSAVLPLGETLYVGTRRGLVARRGDRAIRWTAANSGLAGDQILDVALAGNALWILTDRGISRIALNELGHSEEETVPRGPPT